MKICRLTAAMALGAVTCAIFCTVALAASPGEDVYRAKCAMCHGQDGSGNTPMGQRLKIRDLRLPEVQKETDEQLTAIITNGKPPMPAYGKMLSAAEIKQVVAYLRRIGAKS